MFKKVRKDVYVKPEERERLRGREREKERGKDREGGGRARVRYIRWEKGDSEKEQTKVD